MVATQGSDGMKLYVDGQLVGTNPQTAAQNYTGYWRVGGDSTWDSTSTYLAGTIDEAAVYSTVLTAQQVASTSPGRRRTAAERAAGRRLHLDGHRPDAVSVDGTDVHRLRRHRRQLRLELR